MATLRPGRASRPIETAPTLAAIFGNSIGRRPGPATIPACTPQVGRVLAGAAEHRPAGRLPATVYGRGYPPFASRIVYPKPRWDSDYFMPMAGWSEQPGLWASHL